MDLKQSTHSLLDCVCKGNGIITDGNKDYKCPIHFHCAFDEDYRIQLLRLEYQNMRSFLLYTFPFTESKQIDNLLVRMYNPDTPEKWVMSIQDLIKVLFE